jgi:methylated-DNA-protein-cysteine methyltransferase related protein
MSHPDFKTPDFKTPDFKTPDFKTKVLEVIAQIPEGHVMTYGQVARVAGKPRNPRQVGEILQGLHLETNHPWWRVINSGGRLSTYKVGTGDLQKRLLEAERIVIDTTGKISLERYRWQVEHDETQNPRD